MAYNNDYVPAKDADFDGWLENLCSYVEEKTTSSQGTGGTSGASATWSNIPADKVKELRTLDDAWHTAFRKISGPHTSVDVQAKQDARKKAEQFVRAFVQQYLKFDPVTNEDRTAMRLHNQDSTPTTIPAPKTRAMITELKTKGGFQIEIRFHDEESKASKQRPYGYAGCLLSFYWGDNKVDEVLGLNQSRLMTRSPYILQLPPESEGKFLSCAARWENQKGELGPWGDIQHIANS